MSERTANISEIVPNRGMTRTERLLASDLAEVAKRKAAMPVASEYFPVVASPAGPRIELRKTGMKTPQVFLNFASSNYLNMSQRADVQQAYVEAVKRYGTGANGAPILSGWYEPHEQLASGLARFHGSDAVVLYPSGYVANVGVISTVLLPGDLLLVDRLDHASIIDGGRQAGVTILPYRHNDMASLRKILARRRGDFRRCMVATDGVFSMDATIVDLPAVIECARDFECLVLLDDAHAVGVLGATGRGTLEHYELEPDAVDFHVGTLSKSLSGMGGYVAVAAPVAEYLKFVSRPQIFSASLPPATVAGCNVALQILEREGWELSARLRSNARLLRRELEQRGVHGMGDCTGIVPIPISDESALIRVAQHVRANGLFLNMVFFPAVPRGHGRLRMTVSVAHSESDLIRAAALVADAMERFGVLGDGKQFSDGRRLARPGADRPAALSA